MSIGARSSDQLLRTALEGSTYRFTEQRAAVFGFLGGTDSHPSAQEVFDEVRSEVPGISLATVYKSLETLVACGLAIKLTYTDGSARYDARTDPHHHARCLGCGQVADVPGMVSEREMAALARSSPEFHVTGYRLELTGYCPDCRATSG